MTQSSHWARSGGLGADSEEKHEPVGDIDTAAVDGLKALDPNRPIREADIGHISCCSNEAGFGLYQSAGWSHYDAQRWLGGGRMRYFLYVSSAIRLFLIRAYFLLEAIPSRLSSIVSRFHEAPEIDVRTGNEIKPERVWPYRIYYLFLVPGLSIAVAYLCEWGFKETEWSRSIGFTKESGWWLGLFFGFVLAFVGPAIFAIASALTLIVLLMPGLVAFAILEAIRKLILIVFNKSTSPRTSPFAYFAALLLVIAAVIGLIRHLLA